MPKTFFFYDLETSGVNPRTSRIMQFAGQRTDMDLNPVGDPYNILVKLSEDVLPEPGAIMVTGITPQHVNAEGVTEAEFFKVFINEIALPETIFVGFNNVRFDDEFIRFGLFRNFYDPYEWSWKDGRSRWDILDLTRLTRALRPDGINWPFAPDGKPTNRLEYLASVNKLEHESAHDALSDVRATIAVAKLIKQQQGKLFEYMLNLRDKKEVQKFIAENETFIYVSGKYSSDHEKLAVVKNIAQTPGKNDSVLVVNLLENLEGFVGLPVNKLVDAMKYDNNNPDKKRLPIKALQFNKCPAVAPLSTLQNCKERLAIDDNTIQKNLKLLKENPEFVKNSIKAFSDVTESYKQAPMLIDSTTVDGMLYDGFLPEGDRKLNQQIIKSPPDQISSFKERFSDARLKILVDLYKARNYQKFLSSEEIKAWEQHKNTFYSKNLPIFMKQFEAAISIPNLTKNDQFVLEELKMYVESLIPYSD